MKATPRVRKIALLGKFAYPELRLFILFSYLFDKQSIESLRQSVGI
ncbi:hypothetical protein PAUR_a4443 [Pseudoalteromonas aurantia 208]|uniref:Uncharacterized protein n=1 Tax=Pseudoalteromonas aurantia 208 TaxID=1314867 RepID=A0ABR9EJG0_9GAMM|nr:hypothetical protein [Pseudoalteromonas aurantia 208]